MKTLYEGSIKALLRAYGGSIKVLWTLAAKHVRLSLRTCSAVAVAGGAVGQLARVQQALSHMRAWY